MSGLLSRRAGSRALVPSLAIAGVGAAVAMAAAAPVAAIAAPHHASAHHHKSSHHLKHVSVKGLVAAHHGRTVTVFAKTAKIGTTTSHHKRLSVTFARSSHAHSKMVVGDKIHVAGTGRANGHHVTIVHHSADSVTPAPASLFFGTVTAINGPLLTVSERNSDDGDSQTGGDQHHGQDGGGDNLPANDSPGGPGSGGNSGHTITVDATDATVTVDGSTDTPLAVGDSVAVLGEITEDTVVAADVFGFTTAPAFLRGDISAINGDNVTIGDDNQGDNSSSAQPNDDGGGSDDSSVTVSLTNVPLTVNGTENSSVSDLAVGDKIIVIGSMDSTTGAITPALAFAFNGNDDNPCGHNDGGGSDD